MAYGFHDKSSSNIINIYNKVGKYINIFIIFHISALVYYMIYFPIFALSFIFPKSFEEAMVIFQNNRVLPERISFSV